MNSHLAASYLLVNLPLEPIPLAVARGIVSEVFEGLFKKKPTDNQIDGFIYLACTRNILKWITMDSGSILIERKQTIYIPAPGPSKVQSDMKKSWVVFRF